MNSFSLFCVSTLAAFQIASASHPIEQSLQEQPKPSFAKWSQQIPVLGHVPEDARVTMVALPAAWLLPLCLPGVISAR
jgi:hypothetical protein